MSKNPRKKSLAQKNLHELQKTTFYISSYIYFSKREGTKNLKFMAHRNIFSLSGACIILKIADLWNKSMLSSTSRGTRRINFTEQTEHD